MKWPAIHKLPIRLMKQQTLLQGTPAPAHALIFNEFRNQWRWKLVTVPVLSDRSQTIAVESCVYHLSLKIEGLLPSSVIAPSLLSSAKYFAKIFFLHAARICTWGSLPFTQRVPMKEKGTAQNTHWMVTGRLDEILSTLIPGKVRSLATTMATLMASLWKSNLARLMFRPDWQMTKIQLIGGEILTCLSESLYEVIDNLS